MINTFNWLLKNLIQNKHDIISLLHTAVEKNIIDKESLPIIESVMQMNKLQAKNIMLPRHKIDYLDIQDSVDTILAKISETKHSRFPVVDYSFSEMLGVFHSKDLISYFHQKDQFNLSDYIRPVLFVPEIKPLDSLMYEMRIRQTHLAIIVDEFTNIVGMITLEMIVEQIVGEIDDEHDSVDGELGIVELSHNSYRVKGGYQLSELNDYLHLIWQDDKVETVGGYLIKNLGKIPSVGDTIVFDGFNIEILDADSRKIKLLTLTKITNDAEIN